MILRSRNGADTPAPKAARRSGVRRRLQDQSGGSRGTCARSAARPAAAATDNSVLQEIVVTARKRQENLQDVPLSIDVFTKKDLQNLGISNIDDYAEKVPSISFISVGPGTQLFVMRGVSDGSNPNYSNTSSTGFFIDDMSMSSSGSQPDLHLYDIERIEILNGPQGTTFGAGAMSGAIRYITNKPDLHAFSAGIDFNGGKIQGGQNNWTYEGFINLPIIDGILGFRASAFSDSHGGFINNRLASRTWVNGAVSDNSQWARNNYNRAHVEGGRAALKATSEIDGVPASHIASSGKTRRVHGTRIPRCRRGRWSDTDRNPTTSRPNLDFHVDGDVGIGDLVFASTYWSLPSRQQNEYSQYEQNFNGGAKNVPPTGYPGTHEGVTCLNDPVLRQGAYTGCNPPAQFYSYSSTLSAGLNEVRLSSKPGGRFHWLGGLYWEKTVDKNSSNTYFMPGLQHQGPAFEYYLNYYNGN